MMIDMILAIRKNYIETLLKSRQRQTSIQPDLTKIIHSERFFALTKIIKLSIYGDNVTNYWIMWFYNHVTRCRYFSINSDYNFVYTRTLYFSRNLRK